jgi:hypothetical protein
MPTAESSLQEMLYLSRLLTFTALTAISSLHAQTVSMGEMVVIAVRVPQAARTI